MSDSNPSLQRPASRTARLSAIEAALLSHVVTSQSQLSSILSDEGIEVTQATLSRDLDEMNATKIRLHDGTVAYAVGEQPQIDKGFAPSQKVEQQMSRVLSGLVTLVAVALNQVVVHTPAGAAQYVASVIDKQPLEGVLGTIAGDDTVLVICSDDDSAESWAQWLLEITSRDKPTI